MLTRGDAALHTHLRSPQSALAVCRRSGRETAGCPAAAGRSGPSSADTCLVTRSEKTVASRGYPDRAAEGVADVERRVGVGELSRREVGERGHQQRLDGQPQPAAGEHRRDNPSWSVGADLEQQCRGLPTVTNRTTQDEELGRPAGHRRAREKNRAESDLVVRRLRRRHCGTCLARRLAHGGPWACRCRVAAGTRAARPAAG